MAFSPILDETRKTLPTSMPVAVIMERRRSNSRWVDEVWQAVAVTGDASTRNTELSSARVIYEQDGMQQVLYPGYRITLHVDECESYYHNLKSPEPGCFVITRNIDDMPVPSKVTLSFDEANAYQECEGEAFTVPIPAELYRWTEAFVLQNYLPEKRVKRKRKDWRGGGNLRSGRQHE